MTKRHLKATNRQLLERTYRGQLASNKLLQSHCKVLADHCTRLLREKETLQRQLAPILECMVSA